MKKILEKVKYFNSNSVVNSMEDQKIQKAQQFFAQNKVNQHADEEFKAGLKAQVFQNYLSINENTMEDKKRSFWGKKPLVGAIAFTFLVLAVGVSAFAYTNLNTTSDETQDSQEQKLGAAVAYFDGDLEVENSEGGWNDATLETVLVEGDSLRVTGEGRAIVNLDDGSSIRLNSDSQITLASLNPENIIVENNSGEVYTRVVKLDREFSVVAGEVTYESLGTAYNTINSKEVNGVEVYHSKVSVKLEGQEKLKVEEGNKYYFKNKDSESQDKVIALNKEVLVKDEFIKWNKQLDEKSFADQLGYLKDEPKQEQVEEQKAEVKQEQTTNNTPEPSPSPSPAPAGSISITSIVPTTGSFKVFWSTANVDTSNGFKVVWNQAGNPTYGVDSANYVGAGNSKHVVTGLATGTYYVRVCRYTGSGCDTYSNQVSVSVSGITYPNTVTLNAFDEINSKLTWSTDNGQTGEGFKVLLNGSILQYVNGFEFSPTQNGSYKVCIWKSGSCSAYSNQVEVTTLP